MSVHSSALDPPAPLSRKRVCLPLGTKGGQHSLAGEGAGSQVYVCKKRQVPNQKFLPSTVFKAYLLYSTYIVSSVLKGCRTVFNFI